MMYSALKDRLFGASGTWTLKRCSRRECGLVWLDPMPLTAELPKAYRNYYTHESMERLVPARPEKAGWLRQGYRLLKESYLAERYKYGAGAPSGAGKLLYLVPWRRVQVDLEVRGLSAVPGGRLLDLGCGSGLWLQTMRALGWKVEGVDFDPGAAKAAAAGGLSVRCGSLEEQRFPAGAFDAITMSHVVEHLPDPLQTLAECARLLKPGGRLILWTPNAASFGHRLFGQHWRGLEPPRHLHLFSPRSMRAMLAKAGFTCISIRTRSSRFILQQSYLLWRGANQPRSVASAGTSSLLVSAALALMEVACLPFFRQAGEWLDVQALSLRA